MWKAKARTKKRRRKTEADFEVSMDAALKKVFPFLGADEITHQDSFSVKFGTKEMVIKSCTARVDILVSFRDRPLAIFELKRDGTALTPDDSLQALSYARLLQPMAPFVIVSNNTETVVLETYSGEIFTSQIDSEVALMELLEKICKVSKDDLKLSVDTLMGTNVHFWTDAAAKSTDDEIGRLTGSNKRFHPNFLIRRSITDDVLRALDRNERLILVEGEPLMGKSSVLRDLGLRVKSIPSSTVIYLRGDGLVGLFQRISYLLTAVFEWPVSSDDARNWLLRLSRNKDIRLIFAIDSFSLNNQDLRRDLEELTSSTFGKALRVVLALDSNIADKLALNPNGRERTEFGERAIRLKLQPLDRREFKRTHDLLWSKRICISSGGQFCADYRIPWVLRALCEKLLDKLNGQDDAGVTLPPLLGFTIISYYREQFKNFQHQTKFYAMARAVVADFLEYNAHPDLALMASFNFIVRRSCLLNYLTYVEVEQLIDFGYLRPPRVIGMEEVYEVPFSGLLASEISKIIAEKLKQDLPEKAAELSRLLSSIAICLPLGDLIAAHSILDLANLDSGLPCYIVNNLLQQVPTSEELTIGRELIAFSPGTGLLGVTVVDENQVEISLDSHKKIVDLDFAVQANIGGWLTLSHFASVPCETDAGERLDASLLLELGRHPNILVRPQGNEEFDYAFVHEDNQNGARYMCSRAGIVEPITAAILNFFDYELNKEGKNIAQAWLTEAIETGSKPLLFRTSAALRELGKRSPEGAPKAARAMRTQISERCHFP